MAMRRLVVCYDGTWNTEDKGDKPTNVVNMVRAVRNLDDSGVSQVTFYDKGVGTAGGTDAIKGGGFGAGLSANVLDGYRFLANNFEAGDEIYLFGFSRGAYTARSLAGLIGLAGLLDPADLGRTLISVMANYRRTDIPRREKRSAIAALACKGARRDPVAIKCVGVWDTVGSLGIPGDIGKLLLKSSHSFHDVELGPHVDVALHAVAIDEKRGAFPPTLWASPSGLPGRPGQVVEQVWFAGAHSNVGGSYADSGLSDIALDWMVRRVTRHTGLALDPVPLDRAAAAAAPGIDSRTLLYKGSVLYPYQRIINREVPKGDGFGEWFRTTFPNLDRRNLPEDGLLPVNEGLHASVLERWMRPAVPHDCDEGAACAPVPYRPANLAAVVRAHHQGRTTPVIGWDGEPIPAAGVAWPPVP